MVINKLLKNVALFVISTLLAVEFSSELGLRGIELPPPSLPGTSDTWTLKPKVNGHIHYS